MPDKIRKSRIYSTREWQNLNFQIYALELRFQGKSIPDPVQKKLAELKERLISDSKNHRGDKLLRFGKNLMFYRVNNNPRGEEEVWQDFTHRASITINRKAGDNACSDYRWAAKRAKEALTWAYFFSTHGTCPTPTQPKKQPIVQKTPNTSTRVYLTPDPDMKVWGDHLTEEETIEILNNHCDDNVPDNDDFQTQPILPLSTPLQQNLPGFEKPVQPSLPKAPSTLIQPNLPGFEQLSTTPAHHKRRITRRGIKIPLSNRSRQYGS